jgi:glucose-6-phosphate 1-epimerase
VSYFLFFKERLMHTPGDFPKVILTAPDNARAEIYLHGANVASWITPDGGEKLYLSQRNVFRPDAALRGGIPVVFPQFSGLGPLLKHGFARISAWEWLGSQSEADGSVSGHFQLTDSPATRTIWDHGFQLDLTVTVGGSQLEVSLQVTNTDTQPFDFTAALHTYFRVQDIAAVMVEGTGGLAYREFGVDSAQAESELRIDGETDRIYWNVPGPITLHDAGRTMRVTASGFPDAVIWNPGPEKAAALVDMEPDGYRSMLCIEAAVISQPVKLEPGAAWRGTQTLAALSR